VRNVPPSLVGSGRSCGQSASANGMVPPGCRPKNAVAIQKTLRPSKKFCGHPKNTTQPETWSGP
jgi:hypothetical protein